ncbi:MAG TPA: hypothetical protein VFL99_08470 [Segeticoccus sp.]|uniref:hypothetical protein n=1 Tax=Segeticoccus sp. TaxID=2706531 RepID=UPI002D7F185F|nr:hypothetical protein [Segeticoccus sp.]HET8600346.1 hypothetical protein [Segeticoccus sp.]
MAENEGPADDGVSGVGGTGGVVRVGVVTARVDSALEAELEGVLTAAWERLVAEVPGVRWVEGYAGHAGSSPGSPGVADPLPEATGSQPGASVAVGEEVMPEPVQAALRALLAAAAPGGLVGVDGDAALAVVEAAGAMRGWADAVMVDAARVLFEQLRSVTAGGPAGEADLPAGRRGEALARARSLTVDEVEAATGAGRGQCQKLVGFATAAPVRTAAARAAMRAGRCEFYRAQIVEQATDQLDPADADQIAVEVLGCRPDGNPWSHPQFRGRLRRRVLKHQDPVVREKTHQQAVADRGAWTSLSEDGTAELAITGDAPRVVAARERLEAIARAVRAHDGGRRTLDQLRSDVALDLLTHGTVPPLPAVTPSRGTTAGAVGPVHGSACAPPTDADASTPAGTAPPEGPVSEAEDRWAVYRAVGELPAAQVSLTVSLETLLGVEDGVGQLAGYGPVDAVQARRIAFAPGSVWSRIVTDPLTGWALDRSVNRYRPDPAMAEQVRTRDGTTREPGSTTPAHWPTVDLDHHRPYTSDPDGNPTGGPTSAANLYALTRRGHNRKTRGYWTYEVNSAGLCIWTTATGRTHTTAPCDYDELTNTHRPRDADDRSSDEPPPF